MADYQTERALRNARKFQLWCEYLHGNWSGHELGKLRIEDQLRELGCRIIADKWGCRLVEIEEESNYGVDLGEEN